MNHLTRLLALLALCLPGMARAVTYDATPANLASVQAAFKPGDTMMLGSGHYPRGTMFRRGGTQDKPVVIQAAVPGEAIFDLPALNPDYQDGVTVTGSWLTLRGITVLDAPRVGIYVGASNHVTIEDCRVSRSRTSAVLAGRCAYLTVQDCDLANSVEQHGVYDGMPGNYLVVRRNRIHGCGGCGVQINPANGPTPVLVGADPSDPYDANTVIGVDISNNLITDCGRQASGRTIGAAINVGGMVRGQVNDNRLIGNYAGGIALDGGGVNTPNSGCSYNTFVGNVIEFRPAEGRYCISIRHGCDDNVFRGNTLVAGKSGCFVLLADVTGTISDDNRLWLQTPVAPFWSADPGQGDYASWQARGLDTHSVFAKPEATVAKP